MRVGDRIYYTGDRANGASEGTVTACNPASKYIPESVNIKYDQSRFEGDTMESRLVLLQNFQPGPGRRFYLFEEWVAERQAAFKRIWAGFQANHPDPEKDII